MLARPTEERFRNRRIDQRRWHHLDGLLGVKAQSESLERGTYSDHLHMPILEVAAQCAALVDNANFLVDNLRAGPIWLDGLLA